MTRNWREGSDLRDVIMALPAPGAPYSVRHLTLAYAVTGHEADFPTLARAAHRIVPTDNVMVEWSDAAGHHRNFTQIFREPWSQREGDDSDRSEEFLHKHLAQIEWALVHGTPQRLPEHHLSFMGGALHYIGRELRASDHVVLRPLGARELMWRSWVNPGGSRTSEWLSEVTLQVSTSAPESESA